jgi:succinate dehydrogenase flavin-adding protein (antitoxin of CptAB toxin-antitoxin module)
LPANCRHHQNPAREEEIAMPDVIKLLETDHREVEDLFAKAESISGAAKQQVVAKIASELTLHAEVEEQIVYPVMREVGLDDIVDEAEQEHGKVKQLVAQLESMDGATDEVDAILAELRADVQHHVEEEESEGFRKFRDAADQAQLQALASRVQAAKQAAS